MKTRIKNSDLENALFALNDSQGTPQEPWSRKDGKNSANVGNYHLSQAYGGYNVIKMVNTGGGCSEPAGGGHVTKRECFDRIKSLVFA